MSVPLDKDDRDTLSSRLGSCRRILLAKLVLALALFGVPVVATTVGSPSSAFASHDASMETDAEVMLYSDLEGTHSNSIAGINNGNWTLAQPSNPEPQVVHSGYSRLVEPGSTGRNMRPPINGNFWFPDYYDDHVAFAHFVACDNNNTAFDGCQTASQSI
ncbi:MAG: hypothetical protein DCC49_13215, partial [Acidobacteria bacterium]